MDPLRGRRRAAATANLQDVIRAQLHVASCAGELQLVKTVVDVLIAVDAGRSTSIDTVVWLVGAVSCIPVDGGGPKM